MERLDELNRQLRQLVDQMARRHKVKAMVEQLEGRQLDLASQARQLKEQTYREQLDVDRLEGFSLAKLFYQLSGRLDEQLEKEEAEACAAALRYDAKRRNWKPWSGIWRTAGGNWTAWKTARKPTSGCWRKRRR